MAHIGQAILAPGDTVKIFCTDGLAPKTVENVEKWFNFGGNIQYINCGPKVEDLVLQKSYKSMEKETDYAWQYYLGVEEIDGPLEKLQKAKLVAEDFEMAKMLNY